MPLAPLIRLLRIEYWPKNLLVFLAPAFAHRLGEAETWLGVSMAFFSFCFASSSQYALNDVLGAEEDRMHPTKRFRPIATGRVPLRTALGAALVLGLLSFVTAHRSPALLAVIAAYHAIALAYSWRLHRLAFVDLAVLCALFLLRLNGGAAAAGVEPSYWLIAATALPVASLAALKRFCDLQELAGTPYRGYVPADVRILEMIGMAGAAGSAIVLALYIGGDQAARYYTWPNRLWPVFPIPALLLLRGWRSARRAEMRGHPLTAFFGDPMSWLAACAAAALAWHAS